MLGVFVVKCVVKGAYIAFELNVVNFPTCGIVIPWNGYGVGRVVYQFQFNGDGAVSDR